MRSASNEVMPPNEGKRPYQKPCLQHFGSLVELTRNGKGTKLKTPDDD
jgi:hypothetical protein